MPETITQFVLNMKNVIIYPILGLLFALAVALFFAGTIKFIWTSNNDTDKEEGKSHMIWGIIGMFIMVSAIAIINIFLSTFSIPTI